MRHIKALELLYLNMRLLMRYGGLYDTPSEYRLARADSLCARILRICQYEEVKTLAEAGAIYCEVIARSRQMPRVTSLFLFQLERLTDKRP